MTSGSTVFTPSCMKICGFIQKLVRRVLDTDIMIPHAHLSVWNDNRVSMPFVFYKITEYVWKQLLSSIQSWALCCSVSTTGMLAGIKMSHAAVTSLCRSMKLACELYPSRHIALCLDPYCGLGFALWCLSRWVSPSTYWLCSSHMFLPCSKPLFEGVSLFLSRATVGLAVEFLLL